MEDWILQNWMNLLSSIIAVIALIYAIMTGKVIEWLKGMVAEAEHDLGSGTGQLKLRVVYDKFVCTFPKFAIIVPFPIFSKMVDVALEWLETQLNSNANAVRVILKENNHANESERTNIN